MSLLVAEAQMEHVPKATVMTKLIHFFRQGAICSAKFWRAVESVVPPTEINELFCRLDAADQEVLRELFHERPLSDRALENRAFRAQLRKWVIASQIRTTPQDGLRYADTSPLPTMMAL